MDPISTISSGIIVDGNFTIWAGTLNGSDGLLKVLSQSSGKLISSMSCAKVTAINSNGKMIAVGDEKGELFVWQDEMFNRRLVSNESTENDEQRQSMRERLKALRRR